MIAIFLIAVCLLVGCNIVIVYNANGKLYSNADSIPRSELGLLLGTTPQTRIGDGRITSSSIGLTQPKLFTNWVR